MLLQGSPIRHRVLIGTGSRVHTGVGGDAAGREKELDGGLAEPTVGVGQGSGGTKKVIVEQMGTT